MLTKRGSTGLSRDVESSEYCLRLSSLTVLVFISLVSDRRGLCSLKKYAGFTFDVDNEIPKRKLNIKEVDDDLFNFTSIVMGIQTEVFN